MTPSLPSTTPIDILPFDLWERAQGQSAGLITDDFLFHCCFPATSPPQHLLSPSPHLPSPEASDLLRLFMATSQGPEFLAGSWLSIPRQTRLPSQPQSAAANLGGKTGSGARSLPPPPAVVTTLCVGMVLPVSPFQPCLPHQLRPYQHALLHRRTLRGKVFFS